jgi:hypothetical protein
VYVPRSDNSSSCLSSVTFVDHTPWRYFFICSYTVLSDSGKCFLTVVLVSPGHVIKFSALMAFIQIASPGNPTAVWGYLMDWGIDGKLYTFFTSSLSFSLSFDTDNVHSFSV